MVALRLFTTTLKNLAVELNSFVLTSTQLSNMDEDKGGFKDFRNIQGSRSIVNLVDFACIMTKPTKEDLLLFGDFSTTFSCTPNLVIDIFKNRRGRWNNVRIWSANNLGCCRREDICVSTSEMKIIEDFTCFDFKETEKSSQTHQMIDFYNDKQKNNSDTTLDVKTPMQIDKADFTVKDIRDAFSNQNDIKKRYREKGLSDLL